MNSSTAHRQPIWTAYPARDPAGAPLTGPAARDESWRALGQSWNTGPTGPHLDPGWARVRWEESALHYEAVFIGARARNTACRLNERTWESGDVGEVFLQARHGDFYLEVHVTPENQRLQLQWTNDGLARVRAKAARLDDYMVNRLDWVRSRAQVAADHWAFQLAIPANRLGVERLEAGQVFRTAVCRYHYPESEAVLSSTAPLPVPFFHHREGWHPLVLANAS